MPSSTWRSDADGKTIRAVRQQISAMGAELFEVGLYNPNAKTSEPIMLLRVWDTEKIVASIPWLRHQNKAGRNIYVRPKGEHSLSLIDDLTKDAVLTMKRTGFDPAVVIETSPGNYQAWLKYPERLPKDVSTGAARALAERFGGDRGAADWRHFGRLAGFTNRKAAHLDAASGLFPFVRLIEASGESYPEASRFLAAVRADLERERLDRERSRIRFAMTESNRRDGLKSIDSFRTNTRYGGDGTRIDLAYAVYALSNGVPPREVESVLRSRDLSHKGNERRQNEYVERTIKKALASLSRGL